MYNLLNENIMTKKELIIVVSIVSILFNVVFVYCIHCMIQRSDVATAYIDVLEECVGDELDDTAGSTNEYMDYYNKR